MDDEITAYIKANRGNYTDQAIRETLISVGHEPSAIDEAIRQLGLAAPPDVDDRAAVLGQPSGLIQLAWIAFIIGGVAGLAGFAMVTHYPFSSGGSFPVFLGLYIGIGFGIILILRWAVPKFGLRGIWAVLLGLVLVPVFGALMFGTCVAAFAVGRG